jgi:hypothetical protein
MHHETIEPSGFPCYDAELVPTGAFQPIACETQHRTAQRCFTYGIEDTPFIFFKYLDFLSQRQHLNFGRNLQGVSTARGTLQIKDLREVGAHIWMHCACM